MTPNEALREIAYPLTDAAIVLAMVVFWLLGSLARAAGVLGIWLALMLVPAFFRYALYLLEARAQGRDAPVLGIELFNWMENFWSLFPLILLLVLVQFVYYVASSVSYDAAIFISIVLFFLIPASMGVLGVTRSPLMSINPVALVKLVRSIGADYLWAPAATIAIAALIYFSIRFGLPGFFVNLAEVYLFFMAFTMIGALLKTHNIDSQIDIPDALLADENQLAESRVARRRTIANHAYGFVSRGNRAGGLQHIERWLRDNDTADDAWYWFIEEMLTWESTDAALVLAQDFLGQLLQQGRELEFVKLLSRCLLVNERFRPSPEDREATRALLQRHGRRDLLRQLDMPAQ